MGINFHETQMGQRFFCKQLPDLIESLNRVADSQVATNAQLHPITGGFTPKLDDETKARLIGVIEDPEKAEALANMLCREMASDDERRDRMGKYMAKAIIDNNTDDLLIAICGWSSRALLNLVECGVAYPEN